MRLLVKDDGNGMRHITFNTLGGSGSYALCQRVHSGLYVAMTRLDHESQVPTCLACVKEWWRACATRW